MCRLISCIYAVPESVPYLKVNFHLGQLSVEYWNDGVVVIRVKA